MAACFHESVVSPGLLLAFLKNEVFSLFLAALHSCIKFNMFAHHSSLTPKIAHLLYLKIVQLRYLKTILETITNEHVAHVQAI